MAKTPKYEDKGIPFLSSQNVKNGNIIWKKYKYISLATHQELTKKNKPQIGDILYTRVGSFGEAAVVEENKEFSIFVSLTLIKPKKDILNPYFLKYILNSEKIKKKAKESTSGIGVQNLNVGAVRNFSIPLPKINLQEEIIEELNGFQKIINGCKQVIENYKPTFEINPNWEKVELGNLANLKYGLGESAADEGTHRFIRITDINEFGLLRSNDKKYASIDKSKEEFILKKNDILIARTGATYGKCLYFEGNEPSIFAGYLIKVSLKEKVIPKFFWIFSQSNNYDIQKKQLVVGGGQPQFNANTLKKLLVPVPPIEQQNEIIQEVINQQEIVKGNITLMNKFQHKMTQNVEKIWGDNSDLQKR